jgi:hypothetical protein
MFLDELRGNFADAVIAIVATSAGAVKMLELNPRGAVVCGNGYVWLTMTANVGARRVRKKEAHTVWQGGNAGNCLLLGKRCDYLVKRGKHEATAARVPSLCKCRSRGSRIERLPLGLIDHRLVGAKDCINFCVEFLAHARPILLLYGYSQAAASCSQGRGAASGRPPRFRQEAIRERE